MPILSVDNLAEHGVITDVLSSQLPPNAWTDARNVRFRDGAVNKFRGHSDFLIPPSNWDGGNNQIYWALPVISAGTYYWVYCGLEKVRVYNGSADSDITRTSSDYSATAPRNWTGGIIGGNPVINNGVDLPQSWDKNTSNPCIDLASISGNFDSCGSLRVYKNYLIAMDVTKSATRFPNMVKWSDAAAIDSLPGSWDETDPTTDAGEVDLAESRGDTNVGAVLDSMILRNTNMIYKDSETWTMDFIGGSNIFQFRKVLETQGALARRCMAEFKGHHFVLGGNDVFVTNGQTAESVISEKRKRFLFSDMDGNNYEKSFVFANQPETEMWICYCSANAPLVPGDSSDPPQTLPDKALVWNWRHNTWGDRDLIRSGSSSSPTYGTPHVSSGIVDTASAGDTWTVDDGNWDTWTNSWGVLGFNPQEQSPLLVSDKLYKGDDTDQFSGVSMTSYVERIDMPVGEQDEFVRIKALYPRVVAGSKPIDISIGSQLAPGGAVNYQPAVSFTPGTDQKVDARLTGTHMAVKFGSDDDQAWSVGGYDLEYEVVGRRKG